MISRWGARTDRGIQLPLLMRGLSAAEGRGMSPTVLYMYLGGDLSTKTGVSVIGHAAMN